MNSNSILQKRILLTKINKINSKKTIQLVPRIKHKNRWLFEFEFCLSYWNNKEVNE